MSQMALSLFDINHHSVIANPSHGIEIQKRIQTGEVGVVRQFIDSSLTKQIREYLVAIGQNSLPTYEPIEIGRPNFHRLNVDDERAHVRGCFHQFVFYPWNQDIFNLFELFGDLFRLKNIISGNESSRYMGRQGEDEMITRIAFQFYPAGMGFLNRHQDPYGEHQLTVPTMSLSSKTVDFQVGGAFIEDEYGKQVILDDYTSSGDVVFFDARLTHGVAKIDPGSNKHWLDFAGRWTCLVATNKLSHNSRIQNARDLGGN